MTDQSQESVVDETAQSQQSEQTVKPPRSPEFVAIVTSAISLAVLVAALFGAIKLDFNNYQAMAAADRHAYQARADADRHAYQARADADRRDFQAAMDEFRREILRLSERQSRLEGVQEAQASTSTAGS